MYALFPPIFAKPTRSILAVIGVACAVVACTGEAAPIDCATATGLDRDRCLHDELIALPASDPDAVIAKAGEISDSMMRSAAVSSWVQSHVNEVPMDKGRELCDLLDGRDRGYCERRLSSPHLKR